jgi:hypothetical protein
VVALFSFFSDFSLDCAGLDFVFGKDLWEAFANSIFFGVGFGVAFGVTFGFGVGVADDFGVDVGFGVGFGVGDGNSISLCAAVTRGFSSSARSSFSGFAPTA